MNNIIEEIKEESPWLIFKLSEKLYTINSRTITSIVIKPDETTFIPNVSEHIVGLIHLRGKVVPLIDLKILLNMKSVPEKPEHEIEKPESEDAKESKEMVVVLERDNLIIGFIVDAVLSVESITAYEETEEIKKMYDSGYVTGVAQGHKNDDILLVLDEEKIMINA